MISQDGYKDVRISGHVHSCISREGKATSVNCVSHIPGVMKSKAFFINLGASREGKASWWNVIPFAE